MKDENFELPENSKVLGIGIVNIDKNDFLAAYEGADEGSLVTVTAWLPDPLLAVMFESPKDAKSVLKMVEDGIKRLKLVLIVDTPEAIAVRELTQKEIGHE